MLLQLVLILLIDWDFKFLLLPLMVMIRNDGMEDRYSVLIRFDSQDSTDKFYQHFNNRQFNSLEVGLLFLNWESIVLIKLSMFIILSLFIVFLLILGLFRKNFAVCFLHWMCSSQATPVHLTMYRLPQQVRLSSLRVQFV